MFLSWKHYLRSHPSVGEFNTNSEALQAIFDTSDPAQCFRSLTENRILTCLTRSPMSTEVQASFLHASEKESFQQQKPYSLALMGFGQRAQAVRINPDLVFKTSAQNQKVPDYESFLDCTSLESTKSVTAGGTKQKIDTFAVLPPCLTEELYEEDSMEATEVLWRCIVRIKSLRSDSKETSEVYDVDEVDPEEIGNVSPSVNDDDEEKARKKLAELEKEKASYYKILVFLWAVVQDHKCVPGSPIAICNKKFTKRWEEQQHCAHIKQNNKYSHPSSIAHHGPHGFKDLTGQLEELNNNLTAKKLETSRDKEEEDGLGMKRFKKLSKVHKNILKIFTITDLHSAEHADELEPAPGMLEVLACQGVYDAQGLIHNMLKRNGNVAFIQTGICTALMKGFVTPIDPKTPSNLTPFGTYATLSATGNMDSKALLKFAMKQNYERFDKEDLDLLTSMEITIPKTFHVFHHMLRNMHFLCQYLAGPDSLAAVAWGRASEHARCNEQAYIDQSLQERNFYSSVLFTFHCRFHKFLGSGAFGSVAQVLHRQIDFESTLRDIEEERFIVKAPPFVLENKRPAPQAAISGGKGDEPDKKKQRQKKDRGKRIDNNNKVSELMVPSPLTYEKVFHPEYRKKLSGKHEDGTPICNNYHHRGYCWEKGCKYAGSHGKVLSATEVESSRKFLGQVLANYNAANNVENPVVPAGNPPSGTGESG